MISDEAQAFFALDPVELNVGFNEPRRQSRVTIAFRPLLVLPHVVVLFFLSLLAVLLVFVGWFCALILGRLPRWIAAYEMSVIAYSLRVNSYGFWLANEFPPFTLSLGDYPLEIEVGASRLSRLKVLFRWLLVIPVGIASGLASNGLFVFSPILWVVTLARGRMPQSLFSAAAVVIRYQARLNAYWYLVTDFYPRGLFGDETWRSVPEGAGGRDVRLPLSQGARRLVALLLVLGVGAWIAEIVLPIALVPSENPALVAAEVRFETAALAFARSSTTCGKGAPGLGCLKAQTESFGVAFDRFASDISDIPFSGARLGQAAAVAGQARVIATELAAASRAKSRSAYNERFVKVAVSLAGFEAAAKRLLGHEL